MWEKSKIPGVGFRRDHHFGFWVWLGGWLEKVFSGEMQLPTVAAERQQREVWPLQTNPPGQLQLGQVQVLLPDALVASVELQQADPVNLGFMCGSLPVPTCSPSDISRRSSNNNSSSSSEAALIPAFGLQSQRCVLGVPSPHFFRPQHL